MAHLGMDAPKPPSFDADIQDVIQTFFMVARGRSYTEGQPLPISVKNITDVVSVHPINVPRSILDGIIFELDNLVLDEVAEKNKRDKPKNT